MRRQGGEVEGLVRKGVGLFVLSFLLRMGHLAAMATPENMLLDPARLDMDPRWIHEQAFRVLEQGWLPQEGFPHSPAFCYLAVAVYGFFGSGAYPVAYVANAIFGSLIPLVVLAIARRFLDAGPAMLAAILASLYGPLLHHTAFFLGDVLGSLLAALVLLQLLRLVEAPGWGAAMLLGVTLGTAALGRPNSLILSLMVTLVILARPAVGSIGRRLGLLTLVGAITLAMVAPYTWTASRGRGRLEIICPTMEYNFVYANSETSTGYGSAYPDPGTPLLPAFSFARLKHELTKASYIWRFFEFPCIDSYYLYASFSPLIDWNPLTWRLVGPLALLGLALWLRDPRRHAPLLWFVLWSWIPLNLTLVYGRLRLVMAPVLMIAAARGATWLLAQRSAATRDLHHGRCLALLVIGVIFVNSQDPSRYHGTFYADYSVGNGLHARAVYCLGRAREAIQAGDPELGRRLVALAEEQALGIQRVASMHYQAISLILLADIAQEFHQDPARAGELRNRHDGLMAPFAQLPAADHQGNRFTPPTYRLWPRALDPGPADLSWLGRERRKAGLPP